MLRTGVIAQPNKQSTLSAIETVLSTGPVSSIDIAVAYVTASGAQLLTGCIEGELGAKSSKVTKRWLVSFDYFRTEPIALRMIGKSPNTTIRVHDAHRVLQQNGIPAVPFHPKAFMFKDPKRRAIVAGSGNASRSGLTKGYEAGIFIELRPPLEKVQILQMNGIKTLRNVVPGYLDECGRFGQRIAKMIH